MMKILVPLLMLTVLPSWETAAITLPILMVMVSSNLFNPICSFMPISHMMAVDPMSSLLSALTLWTSTLMIMSSTKIKKTEKQHTMFCRTTLSLSLILVLAFSVNNLMTYYIFFEASLIPTVILVLMWGYQPERLQAGMYLMLYTITASLPLLLGIYMNMHSNHTVMLFTHYTTTTPNHLLNLIMIMAFLVKMPMYLSHLWLPKAHVEAPVAGSMILASVLLKLGAYGLLRLSMMNPNVILSFNQLIMTLCLFGSVMTSISCVRQQDLKSLIAYSSVGHMALLTAGVYTSSKWGWEGSLAMMIAHGLTSSSLFALANMYYENTNTRSLFMSKGLLFITPPMSLWWFILSASNMATPPSLNFLAEILLTTSVLSFSNLTMPLLMMSIFLAASYSLIMYTSTHHGPPSQYQHFFSLPNNNHIISFLHTLPVAVAFPMITTFSAWI